MFHDADLVLMNKIDLLSYVKFSTEAFSRAVGNINEKLKIIPVSCTTGEGIKAWISWLKTEMGSR